MNRPLWKPLIWAMVSLLSWAATASASAPRPEKPNVVLLLTDDLGWQDVTCYDIDEPSPMETPNIDALAKKGVMFWQAYSPAPVCAPSRAAILTGQHPARIGMTSVSGGVAPPHFRRPTTGQTSPWNSGRMPLAATTLAEAMRAEGYATGHSGKWHLAPEPEQHGFDTSCQNRGVQGGMPNRLTGFATRAANDPFRLDENGFPFDIPQDAALKFLEAKKDQPFFLYYATWLVHGPISMKSEQLLQKYVKKLGVELKPEHRDTWRQGGQSNPFYCAMVEQLDYYMGQVFGYLEATDDPRWPGHKLIENTYIIFTSDNGGMENLPEHRFTENAPLANGKISSKEGGIRVPLVITGPGIPAGVQTDVMVNGLDFYPTILSLIGADKPQSAIFDGCDLATLLTGDATDPTLIREADGSVRDTMIWHFPQMENSTAIRVGDYKLRRSSGAGPRPLELYRLYRTEGGKQVRADIEEAHNLAAEMPEKANELEALRAKLVAEVNGRYGYYNPDWPGELAEKETAPRILSHQQSGRNLTVVYENRGAKVVYADLFYTRVDGGGREEWLRADMALKGNNQAIVSLPEEASHYFVNLVDENSFLVVYPKIDAPTLQQQEKPFSAAALTVESLEPPPTVQRTLLDLFPASTVTVPPDRQGTTKLSSTYTKTGSSWGKYLDEEVVFHQEIKHNQDTENSYTVRIGKGGQLYSLRGAFGESIPPQSIGNPWNDEIWQFVAVNHTYMDIQTEDQNLSQETLDKIESSPYKRTYFIHNSGAYIPAVVDSGRITLSCDILIHKDKPGAMDLILRDSNRLGINFGALHADRKGITFNGRKICAVTPGTWYSIELAFMLNRETQERADVTVRAEGMTPATATVPFTAAGFAPFNFIGITSPGTDGIVNIDNVQVKRVTDTFTEYPVKLDYEPYTILDINGPPKSAFVTDKVAATGKRSLELRDAPSLEHGWQPMSKISFSTTIPSPFYCPLLAADRPADGRTYRTVNWGIIPQLKTTHRSPLLYYVQTKDIGDGIIEITYVVHNFSARDDVTFSWLNAPWGGTRRTRLPFHYLSTPDGKANDRAWIEKTMAERGASIPVRDTGGWNLSCATEAPDSPSLALVFGRDKHLAEELQKQRDGKPHLQLEGSIYRYMATQWPDDWAERPESSFRNYDVAVVIPKFNLAPGTSIWYRSYLVVNRRDRAIEQANSLVDEVDYGYRTFTAADTPTVPVAITGTNRTFELFSKPVAGTMPLFLIADTDTGQEVITTDPYIFVEQEPLNFGLPESHPQYDYYGRHGTGYTLNEGGSNWKSLLGYAYRDKPATGDWARLSSLLPAAQFPAATVHHLDLWVPAR